MSSTENESESEGFATFGCACACACAACAAVEPRHGEVGVAPWCLWEPGIYFGGPCTPADCLLATCLNAVM